MQSILKYLLLLINIDEETILNWFGIENENNNMYSYVRSTDISLTTLKLIVEGLWTKLQDGLNLAEIESVLIFILFIRFLILAIRYNLKTSFYITCIGIIAGYLWYRHLIDIISMYRIVLLKLPWVNKLGVDAIELRMVNKQMYVKDFDSSEYSHWYNPAQMLYNAFARGILSKQGEKNYFIDPVSMIIANLPEPMKSNISPTYYIIYEKTIPKVIGILRKFWNQLSGIAAYALITRIGKRYCPYLIRWHWTFLLILGMLEQFLVNFVYRCYFFQINVILPQLNLEGSNSLSQNLPFQNKILNCCIAVSVIFHIGLILFALLHAILGQYFYIPFLVENVELHVGPRPANSIYSGGQTAWQDPKEKVFIRGIPKLWYGWFGRGTKGNFNILKLFKKLLKSFKR
jgi:Uncharacterised protein family